jgi:formylglycine-generating enzyme required for sulfatase activity
MAHIVFDLSSSESRSRFRELAADKLEQLYGAITVELIDELRDQASALRLAAPDYHAIMLELLRASGGCGFMLCDTGIRCPACNAEQNQATWLCAKCGRQMVTEPATENREVQQQPAEPPPSPATAGTPPVEVRPMNGAEYLKDLQDIEQQQGAARLRTIAAEFFSTLDRLPKLKQEVDAMQQMQGVNFDDLATSLEQRLDKAADIMARLDLLPRDLRQSPEMEELVHGLQNAMTLRTIGTWAAEFDNRCNEARTRLAREKEAQERAQRERAEAERRRVEVERLAREEQERKDCEDPELAKRYGIEMVPVPGGSYVMGDSKKQVQVNNFLIGKYPVTQGQWVAVMGSNPSCIKLSDRHPIEMVNYNDVQQFINKLNQMTGRNYRLPTEEEWEYAARSGGKNEIWAGTSNEQELDDYAWTSNNAGGSTQPVGLKKPNGLGIYDMSGNVWEWCSSLYDEGSNRVVRGGGWYADPSLARASHRYGSWPADRNSNGGFRLLSPVQ